MWFKKRSGLSLPNSTGSSGCKQQSRICPILCQGGFSDLHQSLIGSQPPCMCVYVCEGLKGSSSFQEHLQEKVLI